MHKQYLDSYDNMNKPHNRTYHELSKLRESDLEGVHERKEIKSMLLEIKEMLY